MAGKTLLTDICCPGEETVAAVSSVLADGGVVLYPSDTVYGLTASCSSEAACIRVAAAKGYTSQRPFIILVGSIDEALSMTTEKDSVRYMKKYWPGPITLILPASDRVPGWLVAEGGTVALRLPGDPLSKALLEATGLFLVSTSANSAGDLPPVSVEGVSSQLKSAVDIVIDGGMLSGRKPSRIVDVTGDEPVNLR